MNSPKTPLHKAKQGGVPYLDIPPISQFQNQSSIFH